jgi:hypothetical protein
MRMASMPIAVIMQRRTVNHPWAPEAWAAVAVVPDRGDLPPFRPLTRTAENESYLVSGLELQLYPDEDEGYFENCVAPESKVFVKWRMQDGRAMPVQASVSYAEGARMFDSGESADGVPMPGEIHAWLAAYLREHYQPPVRRERHHQGARNAGPGGTR